MLLFGCDNNGSAPTAAGSPPIGENGTQLVDQLPEAQPEESGAVVAEAQPADRSLFPYTGGNDDDDDRRWNRCVGSYMGLYWQWYNKVSSYTNREEECEEIEVKDSNDETVFKVRFQGACNLKVELRLTGNVVDTILNICN